jgi:hypothetical protein
MRQHGGISVDRFLTGGLGPHRPKRQNDTIVSYDLAKPCVVSFALFMEQNKFRMKFRPLRCIIQANFSGEMDLFAQNL